MFGYRSKKFIQRFLAAIAAIFLVFSYFHQPVFAISSVDACVADPVCAAALGAEFNVKAATAAPIVQSATRTVGVEVLNTAGQVVTTTTAAVSTVEVGGVSSFVIGAAAGGVIAAVGLTAAQIQSLQTKAKEKFCQQSSSDADCQGPIWDIYGGTSRYGYYYYYNPEKTYFGRVTFYTEPQPDSNVTNGLGQPLDRVQFTLINGETELRYLQPGTFIADVVRLGTNWNDLSQDKRNAASDLLTDSDIAEVMKDLPSTPIGEFSSDTSGIKLTFPGDAFIIEDGQIKPVSSPYIISNPNNQSPPNEGTDTDKDGIPDTQDLDDDNDGIPDTEDPDDDNDGTPDENEVETPETQPIKAIKFKGENWLKHGVKVFSTKFPFDILGNLNTVGSSNECPKYTFFNYDFELCPIRDMLSILKVPALIAFLVWAFFSI